jgi:hypothetical protein
VTQALDRMTELRIDPNRIKPAVLKEVQAKLGMGFVKALNDDEKLPDALWAMAYAVGRRIDPSLTWEEAGEIDVVVEADKIPPTNGTGSTAR